jgi:hypothetical protein
VTSGLTFELSGVSQPPSPYTANPFVQRSTFNVRVERRQPAATLHPRQPLRATVELSGVSQRRHFTPANRFVQRERQPPARVWEDQVANPNACEQDRLVNRARSAGRLDAVLGCAPHLALRSCGDSQYQNRDVNIRDAPLL